MRTRGARPRGRCNPSGGARQEFSTFSKRPRRAHALRLARGRWCPGHSDAFSSLRLTSAGESLAGMLFLLIFSWLGSPTQRAQPRDSRKYTDECEKMFHLWSCARGRFREVSAGAGISTRGPLVRLVRATLYFVSDHAVIGLAPDQRPCLRAGIPRLALAALDA